MPDLTIGDVPQEEVEAIGSRAVRHGRSRDEELRHLIHEAAAEELLVQKLEQAQRATDALRTAAEKRTQRTAGTAVPASVQTPARRRSRAVEPTPRKR